MCGGVSTGVGLFLPGETAGMSQGTSAPRFPYTSKLIFFLLMNIFLVFKICKGQQNFRKVLKTYRFENILDPPVAWDLNFF